MERHGEIKGYMKELGRIFQILFTKLEYILLVYEKDNNTFTERELYYVTNTKNKSNVLLAVSALPDMGINKFYSYPVEIPHQN